MILVNPFYLTLVFVLVIILVSGVIPAAWQIVRRARMSKEKRILQYYHDLAQSIRDTSRYNFTSYKVNHLVFALCKVVWLFQHIHHHAYLVDPQGLSQTELEGVYIDACRDLEKYARENIEDDERELIY